MPDNLEIQRQLEGTSRDDSIATGVELNSIIGEISANVGATWLELVYQKKSDSTFLHFPSEEKLAQVVKADVSGAMMIGVDETGLTNIAGSDVQTILENIDTLITPSGWAGVVLQDGTAPLTGNWDVGNYDITNIEDLSSDSILVGATNFSVPSNTGWAGFGIATPLKDMQIHGSDSTTSLLITNTTTGSTAFDGTEIKVIGLDFGITNQESGAITLTTGGSLTLDSAGDVTISEDLDVLKNLSVTGIVDIQSGGSLNVLGGETSLDGDLTFTPTSGTQDYLFTDVITDSTALALEGQSANSDFTLAMYAVDGDSSENVVTHHVGYGAPQGMTNMHRLSSGWDASNLQYEISTEYAGTQTSKAISIFTGGNQDQLLLNTDGTIDVLDDMTVGGAITSGSSVTIDLGATAGNPRLYFDHDNFGANTNFIEVDRNTDVMEFWVNSINAINIDSSGNVGIGTDSPNYPVDILAGPVAIGATRAELFVSEDNTAATGRGGGIAFGRDTVVYGGIGVRSTAASDSNTKMTFATRLSGTVTEQMTLNQNGDFTVLNGEVFLNLPTSAGTTGSLWNDSGTVKVA